MGRSIIYENLPAFGTPLGFFFYAFIGYLAIKLLMFVISSDPQDLIEESERELQAKLNKQKGLAMR